MGQSEQARYLALTVQMAGLLLLILFLLPGGEVAGGEGGLDVDEALVAGAAEAEADVALLLDEGAVNEDVELADDVEQRWVLLYFFPCVAGVTPDVVAQLLLDAVDEGADALGLLQGVSATEGDGGLVIGDDAHELVEGALFPTPWIPRGGVVASGAMVAAARQVD